MKSLQGRLLAGVLGGVSALWVAAAVATWLDARHELDELLDGHLAQAAALLVVQQGPEPGEEHLADAPQLHRYAPRAAFQVWHEGRLVLHSSNAPTTPMTGRSGAAITGFETLEIGGHDWRVFAAHGAERDVQVFVGEQARARREIVLALLRGTLWPLLLVLPLLGTAGWWAVRRGLAPLRTLGETLATREPQALAPVVLDDAPTEMQPLLDALNALFTRIAGLIDAERRFTADAAHELRTPIAAIRTQAQVAMLGGGDTQRRHALQATLEGCDRATHLVEQLLTLSRLEAGATLAAGPCDAAALLRRVAAELAPRALARGQQLELLADGSLLVAADEALLGMLLRNLVDNALRYSPDGAQVRLALQADGAQALLTVDDSGPGMDPADLARLGERFFRVLGSGASGSGLGWSIVRRIAAVLGAEVSATRSVALGGLGVNLRLRRA